MLRTILWVMDRTQLTGSDPHMSWTANIIRCLWCFTLLMNVHDFVTEFFKPEHIFRDARTVSFYLTTDHISTCLMMFSARFKTAQFWSVLIRGEWKCSTCSCQRRWCGCSGTENWYGRARVENWQPPWSPMESAVWIRDWWTSRKLATDAVVCTVSHCLDSWQRMQWYAPSLNVSTAGNGCSGMQRLSVSRQLVMDTVVCPGLSIK